MVILLIVQQVIITQQIGRMSEQHLEVMSKLILKILILATGNTMVLPQN